MHKILVQTEFRLLQDMGYEVFRPPYLTDIPDPSVSESNDFGNSTLPVDVAAALSSYNFFFNPIEPRIAELLNAHFDVMVVTISAEWLKQALKTFEGTIIFRCYGQLGTVSRALLLNGCRTMVEARRPNFHFWPHAPECLAEEDAWLAALATVVPYWLTHDVLALQGCWARAQQERRPSIALACPNIGNTYYSAHFRYLKRFFEERCFRYYGVQIKPSADPNVVGTLSRDEQLARLACESGFLYTYREPTVCYLPPIEMMVLGGPVLYLPGSLLAGYFDEAAPGLVQDEAEALTRSKQLIRGDRGLMMEVIASQAPVVHRYTPAYGEALFRAEFLRIVPLPSDRPSWQSARADSRSVLVLAPRFGAMTQDDLVPFASVRVEGMRRLVWALTDAGIRVVVAHDSADQTCVDTLLRSALVPSAGLNFIEIPALLERRPTIASEYAYLVASDCHLNTETLDLPLPLLACVMHEPHQFFAGRGWFDDGPTDTGLRERLVRRARLVLTHTAFAANDLSNSSLRVPVEKIVAFPLPFDDTRHALDGPPPASVAALVDEPYVLSAARPGRHYRLDLTVMAWLLLNRYQERPIRLVVTLESIPPRLRDLIAGASMLEYVHCLSNSDAATEAWVYANARCLAMSTELDESFPFSLLKALLYCCPVVCSDNAVIASELGPLSQYLQITPFADVPSLAAKLALCVLDPETVRRRQALAKRQILDRFSYDRFKTNVVDLHRLMMISPEELDD
jgi:glycosyltransferase involved in cell wall biosynthesis